MANCTALLFPFVWLLGAVAEGNVTACSGSKCPEQRHLSFAQQAESMVAMWVTPESVKEPACNFGVTKDLGIRVGAASTRIWQVRGISEYSHVCELSPLVPGQRYFYKVGDTDSGVWSDIASFLAKPNTTSWAPTVLVFGDMGVENDVSLPKLVEEAASGENDFVLHVGDLAYDFHFNGGQVGRSFMRDIDPIASRLPYMTCIGNHEGGTDFDHVSPLYHYMHRFQMPGKGDLVHGSKGNNVYYSFDAGPAHFVVFSSEVYFWQLWDVEAQFRFLAHDLGAVDRSKTPWVITMAHRPMYCSNTDGDDCTKDDSNLRTGLPVLGTRMYQLEKLFHAHHVDLSIWAHEHTYERTWPVYDNQVKNGTTAPFVDPGAAVHIVTGNAGCREHQDSFNGARGNWSAIRSVTYGYGKLRILNASHLRWQQFDAVQGMLVDEFIIVKTKLPTTAGSVSINSSAHISSMKDVDWASQSRESIYQWTRACTSRGVFPQHGCIPIEQTGGLTELVV